MIKNLVFDLGNVLVEFRPKDYLSRLGIHDNDTERLTQLIFKDKRWNDFDRGTISIEEYARDLKIENSQYSEHIDRIFDDGWSSKLFKPKEETATFLKELSNKYNIYILSNVSEHVLNYLKTLDFFRFVTSGTYSYLLKSCKPEEKIYISFFKDNELEPEECLFLDDLEQNIEAGRKFGMHGIVFKDNFDEVRDFLKMHETIE